jgi:hypothetical protein
LRIDDLRDQQPMGTSEFSDEAFLAFLYAHSELRTRFASIARAVENADGGLDEADAVEERLVEETRALGREALQGWAEQRADVTEREIRQQPHMHRQGEKNSAGIRNSAK